MKRIRSRPNAMRFGILSAAFILGLLVVSPLARALPSGFISEVIPDARATSGVFFPNPRTGKPALLVVSKNGRVKVHEDPDSASKDWLTVLFLGDHICTNGERGLQSALVHPDFEKNHYIYLFYTAFKEGCLNDDTFDRELHPHNLLVRFEMDPETLMLDYETREEIWRSPGLFNYMHNGGAMVFGNDGKIYLTHGEAGVQENAQDLTNVFGTLMRLNDDGSTPDDNPYTITNGYDAYDCRESQGMVPVNSPTNAICSEIYAYGLRNPFRMALDPNENKKTKFSIQDVGGRTWEELSYGGTDYAKANYGWKDYEGPCHRHLIDECPIADGPNDVEPFHYYMHLDDRSGCVSGAAFVPEDLDWPDEYKYFFADFVWRKLYTLTESPDGGCRTCSPPVSPYKNETFFSPVRYPGDGKNEGRIVDIAFGPYEDTQALYVFVMGTDLYRIRYTGIHDDPPVPDFTVSKEKVEVNEMVEFDASTSFDPEGEELAFKWFFGDERSSKDFTTGMTPTHSYDNPGKYDVVLYVTDAMNQIQQRSMEIVVGSPPNATIISPVEGDEFFVGQVLRLEGEANYLNGTAFSDSQLQWEVRKHHDDHFHPYLDPTYGNNIELSPAPEPEDFYASTNSYLEIILYAADEYGVTRKVTRNVYPSLVEVGIGSNLNGSKIEVNGERVSAFSPIIAWKDQTINLKAQSDSFHQFLSWSDGLQEDSRSIVVNETDPVLTTANYCAVIGASCSDQVGCCSGYCQFPLEILRSASTAVDRICMDDLHVTSSPTGRPTLAPTDAANETELEEPSEEVIVSGTLDEEDLDIKTKPDETESTPSESASLCVQPIWTIMSFAVAIIGFANL